SRVEHDHLRPVVVAKKHGEVRNGHRPPTEVLEHDDRTAPAELGLGALQGALECLGAEPPSTGLELEIEVRYAAGGGPVKRAPALIRVGGGAPVPEDHGEGRGPALIGLLRDEGHRRNEVTLTRGDIGAHGVQRDRRAPAPEKARQEEHEGYAPSESLKRAAHRAYYNPTRHGPGRDRVQLLGLRCDHARDQVQDRLPALRVDARLLGSLTITRTP